MGSGVRRRFAPLFMLASSLGSGVRVMVDNVHEYRDIREITEAGDINLREWQAPGPMSAAYIRSEKLVRGMIGPVGFGKTTTMELGEVF